MLGIGLIAWAGAAWHVLFLYGVVFGIGNGLASITPVTIMVTNTFPGRMGLASGIAISGMSVGQLVMVGGMAFVMVGAGWRSVYVWCGIAHLALLPFLLAVPDDAKSAAQRVSAAAASAGLTLAEAARTPTFWLLMLAQGVCGLNDFFVSTHVVAFAQDKDSLPGADAIPFDMFGVAFSHQGEGCTFETLATTFAVDDPAVTRIAAIVHDLDLKDGRFGAAEAPAVAAVIDGLQLSTADDDTLLERGITLFESLYLAFAQSARTAGPRPVARSRQARRPKTPAPRSTRRS